MGLKISTKIDNYDYPEEERDIAYYGPHTIDIRPYVMSFFLRTLGDYPPIDLDEFSVCVIQMIDDCIKKHGEEMPTFTEISLFNAHLKSRILQKIVELNNNRPNKA